MILGNTRLVQRRVSGDKGLERLLGEIDTATSRASDLVDQILTFARVRDVGDERAEFCGVVRETLALVERVAGPDLHVTRDLPSEELWVPGNRSQLGQVVMNLCTNGLGAMPQGGSLRVRVALADEAPALVLQVEDSGHGTAPAQETADTAATSPRPAGAVNGEEILVVDDEPQVLQVMAEILLDAGYRVTSSESGTEALELLREAHVLVPNLPAIIVSGYHDPLGPAPETSVILRKPVELATLSARVQQSLSRA
ncbi:MAG: hypothetical protein P8R42_15050 [Candidatus Binatia bacterium]|nr:hypothetical protein [Candidatus Binatia bacterium]